MPAMKIRWKFLLLLLAIALIPLVVSSLMQRRWARRQGFQLAGEQREILIERAETVLQRIVDDYGRALVQSGRMLDTLVQTQAWEMERALSQIEFDPEAPAIVPVGDIDAGEVPPGVQLIDSATHEGWDPEGMLVPQPITPKNFSVLYFNGPDEELLANVARVAGTTEMLDGLRTRWPGLLLWQHTTLEDGAQLCLPGHGQYADAYNPVERAWYTSAMQADGIEWTPIIDVSTGRFIITISTPIRVDGEAVGVTSIDIPLTALVEMLDMPKQWEKDATVIIVAVQADGSIRGVAEASDDDVVHEWDVAIEDRAITSDDPRFDLFLRDIAEGRGGVRRIEYEGQVAFWAYGPPLDGYFPLIILPHSVVAEAADEAEMFVLGQIAHGLKLTGIILLVVVGLVTLVAIASSKRITRPIHQLVDATTRLRDGDFEARVAIHTRDELEELGETFNAMVPRLLENQQLKQSLAVAMEVQQHLLPQEAPQLPGFDIFGQTHYCDETGGDYYDFIPLSPTQLAVALGDITGHGIGAAVLMASGRGVLRSQADRFGDDLVGLFDMFNLHLVEDTDAGRFLTLYYAVLDATEGQRKVTWISAGHDPAMWLHTDGTIDELPNSGLPLGIIEEGGYTANEPFLLADGEVLLIGSDGIWEAENANKEQFGKDRLRALLRQLGAQSAEQINRQVMDAVLAFVGDSPRTDDITLTVIRAV